MSSGIKGKIEKLLNKAAKTDNADEAQTFTEAAERLMLKFGIDAADLEAAGEAKPEPIIQESRLFTGGTYPIAWVTFAANIADGFGPIKTFQRRGDRYRRIYFVGHETDVELFLVLFDSLQLQASLALKSWQGTDLLWGEMNTQERKKASKTFLVAFGARVGNRLAALRTEVQQEASTGAALVLVSKEQRLQNFMDEKKLPKSRGMELSESGKLAGIRAGSRAILNNQRSLS